MSIYFDFMSIPENEYDIVYADPPWPEYGGGKIKRGADRHYDLMTLKDIEALPVERISKENCHLYLWTTNNYLPAALKVMEKWGFSYKTMITWVKDRFGLGQYFRGQTEHCLFGVRGNIPYKIEDGKRQQDTTLLIAPREEHSKKPEQMRERIIKVSDREGFKKIELFARRSYPGWDCFGNELRNEHI